MSRHEIATRNPALRAVVGWDPGLATFFAQVWRGPEDADEKNGEFWTGADHYGQHPTLDTLVAELAPYADVEDELMDRLTQDRVRQGERPKPAFLARAPRF